jgi:hypothetical protein
MVKRKPWRRTLHMAVETRNSVPETPNIGECSLCRKDFFETLLWYLVYAEGGRQMSICVTWLNLLLQGAIPSVLFLYSLTRGRH